jgi:hypothetical protein
MDILSFVAIATSLIGFVTVWVKIGIDKGHQDEIIKVLVQKTEENKKDIMEIKSKTHGIELRIAEFMGEIRAKFDFIKETVNELKSKNGGRNAAKK